MASSRLRSLSEIWITQINEQRHILAGVATHLSGLSDPRSRDLASRMHSLLADHMETYSAIAADKVEGLDLFRFEVVEQKELLTEACAHLGALSDLRSPELLLRVRQSLQDHEELVAAAIAAVSE